ncbi:hypothetical protein PIIN_10872 [Serendipita indica DSM 11827]|uniref:Uncharacterized protein n=1 Tax=Serendipita indica (strain DSM 11827) TaxID=1109443 RepID=G4TZZ3_SERID|nr:hypothetical protein PIIN_10872 [Serendipita indica DSM 11827]
MTSDKGKIVQQNIVSLNSILFEYTSHLSNVQ